MFHLPELAADAIDIQIQVISDASCVLFGTATPYNELVLAQGTFMMNTKAEIVETYADYRSGKPGVWA